MTEYGDKIFYVGVTALIMVAGVMGLVFINYIKGVMKKIDDIPDLISLVEKVDNLVEKVEKIFTSVEVVKTEHDLEIKHIKERLDKLEKVIHK